jgi:hypothetical protein
MRIATIAAFVLALTAPAALAAEKQVIDPTKKSPTEAVGDAVPDMTAPKGAEMRPATKSVGDAVPPMEPAKPGQGAAAGQGTTPTPGATGQVGKPAGAAGTTTGTIPPPNPTAKAPPVDGKTAPPPSGDARLAPPSDRAVQ